MKHLSEEDLVLANYGEGEDNWREHLAGCAECRAALDRLARELAAMPFPEPPERGEEYGAHVWRRLRPRLGSEKRGFDWMAVFRPRPWAVAASVASLVVAAFLLGRYWPAAGTRPAPVNAAQVRERVLLVALGDHLDRSQMVLVELENTRGEGTVDISEEQQRAEDLIASNRLYRQTAARAGQPGVARVLEDLERVLIEIARSPSKVSSAEFEDMRERIEQQGILFKVRVIDSQIRQKEQAPRPATENTKRSAL